MGPQTHPVVLSPVSECVIGMDMLRSCRNSHTGSLTCGVRVIVVGKANWKPLELLRSWGLVTETLVKESIQLDWHTVQRSSPLSG